jgi:hypothetical protein
MVFAAQRMAGRRLERKDTFFRIRGRDKTSGEVQRYWRRRQINPEDLSPIPTTPPDVRYWTPAPEPPEASPLRDANPTFDAPPAPLHQTPLYPSGNGIAQNIWQRPTVFPRLSSPGHLRDLESVLRGAGDYYEMCMPHAVDRTTSQQSRNMESLVAFYRDGIAALSSLEHELPASAQSALTRALGALPDILRDRDPRFITFLVGFMGRMGQKERIQYAQVLLQSVVREAIAICSTSHPIIMILQAILRSLHMMQPFVEVLMQLGVDTLTKSMGAEDPWTYDAVCGLQSIRWQLGDFAGVLRHCEMMYKSNRHRSTQSEDHMDKLMHVRWMMASCHLKLGNHGEAAKLIEDGLAICATHEMNTRSRIHFSVFFLRLYTDLRRVLGLPGAVEALQNALVIGQEHFGVDDAIVMDTADRLKGLLERTGANDSHVCE